MFSRGGRARGLSFLLAGFCLVFSALAAEPTKWGPVTPKTKLKIGDRVQVAVFREWQEGRIIEFLPMGWVRVEVHDPRFPGFPTPHMAAINELRVPINRPAKSHPRRSADASNPFDPDAGFRTWQDDTGQFKIEGKLLEVTDGAVRLKRRDGREVTVPLHRLSSGDRRYLNGLKADQSPSGEKSSAAADEEASTEEEFPAEEEPEEKEEPQEEELKTKAADWSAIRQINWPFANRPSSPAPDGAPTTSGLGSAPIPLPIDARQANDVKRFWTVERSPRRIMISFDEPIGHGKPQPVLLCDLKQPAASEETSLAFPGGMVAMDIDPEGNQILTSSDGGFREWELLDPSSLGAGLSERTRSRKNRGGDSFPELPSNVRKLVERMSRGTHHEDMQGRVDLWRVTQGKLEHQFGWLPLEHEIFGRSGMRAPWTAFVDAQHVLTCGDGRLTLWELPAVRAVYSAPVAWGTWPALSPGHKYVAVLATTDEIFLIDALTGEVKGCYEGADCEGGLAFRPDGRQIALADSGRLIVWNLDSSSPYRDIGVVGQASVEEPPLWVSDRHVLVGRQLLVDVEAYLTVWDYWNLNSNAMDCVGSRPWAIIENANRCCLEPLNLPHGDAERRARELRQDDMLAIRPGDTVSFEVNCEAPDANRDQIAGIVERRLESHGLKIAPGRPCKCVVDIKLGKTCTIEYRGQDWSKLTPPTITPPTPLPTDPKAMMEEMKRRAEQAISANRVDPNKPFEDPMKKIEVKETVTARERIILLRFVVHGETAWSFQRTFSPPLFIAPAEGETAEQAVARSLHIDADWFRHVSMPRCVTWPEAFLGGKTPKKEP